jgi:hypothetical protein
MMKTSSDESLRMLLRLLIDEIVEDLSRSGSDAGAGQFKNRIVSTGLRSSRDASAQPNIKCVGSCLTRCFRPAASDFQRADSMNETGR